MPYLVTTFTVITIGCGDWKDSPLKMRAPNAILNDMADRVEHDPELSRRLSQWRVPEPSAALDERVLAAYRRRQARFHFWSRFPTIAVPLPVASAIALAFLLMAFSIARRPDSPHAQSSNGAPVITSMSLAGFRPMDEINVSVISAISEDILP
jgi:hypothetical protein